MPNVVPPVESPKSAGRRKRRQSRFRSYIARKSHSADDSGSEAPPPEPAHEPDSAPAPAPAAASVSEPAPPLASELNFEPTPPPASELNAEPTPSPASELTPAQTTETAPPQATEPSPESASPPAPEPDSVRNDETQTPSVESHAKKMEIKSERVGTRRFSFGFGEGRKKRERLVQKLRNDKAQLYTSQSLQSMSGEGDPDALDESLRSCYSAYSAHSETSEPRDRLSLKDRSTHSVRSAGVSVVADLSRQLSTEEGVGDAMFDLDSSYTDGSTLNQEGNYFSFGGSTLKDESYDSDFESKGDDIVDAIVQQQIDSLEDSDFDGEQRGSADGDVAPNLNGADGSLRNTEMNQACISENIEPEDSALTTAPIKDDQQVDEGDGIPEIRKPKELHEEPPTPSRKNLSSSLKILRLAASSETIENGISADDSKTLSPPPPPPLEMKRSFTRMHRRSRSGNSRGTKSVDAVPSAVSTDTPSNLAENRCFSSDNLRLTVSTDSISTNGTDGEAVKKEGSSPPPPPPLETRRAFWRHRRQTSGSSRGSTIAPSTSEEVPLVIQTDGDATENVEPSLPTPPPPPPYKLLDKKRRRKKKTQAAARRNGGACELKSSDSGSTKVSSPTNAVEHEAEKSVSKNQELVVQGVKEKEPVELKTDSLAEIVTLKNNQNRESKKAEIPFDEASSTAAAETASFQAAASRLMTVQSENAHAEDDLDIPMVTNAGTFTTEHSDEEPFDVLSKSMSDSVDQVQAGSSEHVEDTSSEQNKIPMTTKDLTQKKRNVETAQAESLVVEGPLAPDKYPQSAEKSPPKQHAIAKKKYAVLEAKRALMRAASRSPPEKEKPVASVINTVQDCVVKDESGASTPCIENKPSDGTEDFEKERTAGWDTRLVTEHPPESAPPTAADAPLDWDPTRMHFDSTTKESKDENDVFLTSSWLSAEDAEVSEVTDVISNKQEHLTRLMRDALPTESHPETTIAQPTSQEGERGADATNSVEAVDSPYIEGAWPSTQELTTIDMNCKQPPPDTKDDEALLADVARGGIDGLELLTQNAPSQKERIESYISPSFVSDSSSSESEAAEDIEEDSDEDDVQYQSHNAEVDSDDERAPENFRFFPEELVVPEVQGVIFDVAQNAAITSNDLNKLGSRVAKFSRPYIEPPSPEKPRVWEGSHSRSSKTFSAPEEQDALLQKTARDSESSPKELVGADTARIPRLDPPSPEKLKKWEESKNRPFKNINTAVIPSLEPDPVVLSADSGDDLAFDHGFIFSKSSSIEGIQLVPDTPHSGNASNFAFSEPEPNQVASPEEVHSGTDEQNISTEGLTETLARASESAAKLIHALETNTTSAVVNLHADESLSDIQQNKMSSMIFCGGAETLKHNFLVKMRSSSNIVPEGKEKPPSRESQTPFFGEAIATWRNAPLADLDYEEGIEITASATFEDNLSPTKSEKEEEADLGYRVVSDDDLAIWLRRLIHHSDAEGKKSDDAETELRSLLRENSNFDMLCALVATKVSAAFVAHSSTENSAAPSSGVVKEVLPFSLSNSTQRPEILAANFVSFVQRIGKLASIESPFKDENPFVFLIVGQSIIGKKDRGVDGSMQQLLFENNGSNAVQLTRFFYDVVQSSTRSYLRADENTLRSADRGNQGIAMCSVSLGSSSRRKYDVAPEGTPSPFETGTWTLPSTIVILLGFLGDPVAVCRMKMVNRFCNRVITDNEHTVMRDAVRYGGMSMNVRPAFWMWITLTKCRAIQPEESKVSLKLPINTSENGSEVNEVLLLAKAGREGKSHHVIERDVARAFGNFPPHKTGARLRHDSIVRALITYGRGRLIKRGVKGGGEIPPVPRIASQDEPKRPKAKMRVSTAPPPWELGEEESEGSETPTDTVSDWGGVSPVASFAESIGGEDADLKRHLMRKEVVIESQETVNEEENDLEASPDVVEELALSGNALSSEMKIKLQHQLDDILHALAARHEDVGYCQGMDYVVAHILRVLQDTVKWQGARGFLPVVITGAKQLTRPLSDGSSSVSEEDLDKSLVVEETVFRVMDCLFTTYNLKHMYFPELRSLKICCRVFERLIKHKLPVLADHFEHHELNVGLFALGWFQTLFLYLPSMPTATVCHMWDIWLVERSFKIFFRVGTAILFLSQPILLNHDLEGMMTYLNTFPDATLLKSDILIACALQIKVTNSMLTELEREVTGGL